jgi:hypothetical protein
LTQEQDVVTAMDEYRWEAHLQDLLRVASRDDQAVLQIDDLAEAQDRCTASG